MTPTAPRARRRPPNGALLTAASANEFLFGLLFNQGQSAKRAWQAPEVLRERLGTLKPSAIAGRSVGEVAAAIALRPALHRFPRVVAGYVWKSCDVLAREYESDARRIWSPGVGLAVLLKRLEGFPGIGRHKAIVGAFLLTHEHHVVVYDDATRVSIRENCAGLYRLYAPIDAPRLHPGR